MAVKVAINGLGRIGKCVAKIISDRDDIELVALNAGGGSDSEIAYGLKFDTIFGKRDDVRVEDGYLYMGNTKAKILNSRDPKELDFASFGAEVVLECTGVFLTAELVRPFLDNGVKKVIFSAPAKDDTATYVIGANENEYKGESIISNASCTTNGLAPLVKVLDDAFGIQKGLMTTIHSYTSSQPILDGKPSKKDMRKGRAGAANLVPTTTGAAKAIGKVLPKLNGKLNGQSIRVPTSDVSIVDLTVTLEKNITLDEVKHAFETASATTHKGILGVDYEYRVSTDFIGEATSTVVAMDTIQVIGDNMVKVLSWYDNEWGYSCRLVDMAVLVSKK
ncbi:MAG: type I glyceraldehyde-3-phosphate dehydrogenase [Epsilonproteobacteria bacterium]|nr:type I glyceraldehyde-3-phosphate dehydrogenase [Campylobacterota bacterium]